MVGLEGHTAFTEDRAVDLAVSRTSSRADWSQRRDFWSYIGLPPGTGGACSPGRKIRSGWVGVKSLRIDSMSGTSSVVVREALAEYLSSRQLGGPGCRHQPI